MYCALDRINLNMYSLKKGFKGLLPRKGRKRTQKE